MSWRAPILIAIWLVFGVLLLTGTFTNSGGYTLRAEFADASGLRTNYFVKEDGVVVGRVTSVTVSRRDTALVTMAIDRSALPIGRDATATIRPNSFFGEHFVDLQPGNVTNPAPSGMQIPLSRTSEATELDQLLDVFDPQTRIALAEFLNESGIALAGRGQDLAATLSLLPHTLQEAQQLISNLAIDNHALGQLIDRSSQIVSVIAGQRAPLGRLIDNAAGALRAVASRNASLAATVRDAPDAVSRFTSMLGYLRTSSQELVPAARGLLATAGPLTGMLQALPAFATAARPTLARLQRVAPFLDQLGARATPVVRGLEPTTALLVRFAGALSPVVRGLNNSIEDVLGYYEGYARALQDQDSASHIYHAAQTFADLSQMIQSYEQMMRLESAGMRRRGGRGRPRLLVGALLAPTHGASRSASPGHAPLPAVSLPLPAPSVPPTLDHLLRYLVSP
jgi:phospholipid/cholesterol/gamma-HCH transport system substrate-binding protein